MQLKPNWRTKKSAALAELMHARKQARVATSAAVVLFSRENHKKPSSDMNRPGSFLSADLCKKNIRLTGLKKTLTGQI